MYRYKPPTYICLDLETTGLDAAKHGILEMGAVALDNQLNVRQDVPPFHALVKPQDHHIIEDVALNINGHHWIKDPESENYQKALSYDELKHVFYDGFLKDYYDRDPSWIIMVGWNISFDEGFLKTMFELEPRYAWPFHYHKLDLLSICRFIDLKRQKTRRSYKLETLARHYLGDDHVKKAHTALHDAQTALKVLNAVINDKSPDAAKPG